MSRYQKDDDGAGFAIAFVVILILLLMRSGYAAEIPSEAWRYQRDMTRSAWRTFGPTAPVATLAAQIQQESSWRINAVSLAGAQGFAQFMPATAADMAHRFPNDCAPANPFSPRWAFNCRDRYLQTLIVAASNGNTDECSEWAFGFRAYNGGGTWVKRDRRLAAMDGADPNNWLAVYGYNAGRSEASFRENSEYPIRIFNTATTYAPWGDWLHCY